MQAGIHLWGLAPLIWGVCLVIAVRLVRRAPSRPARPAMTGTADALRRAA